MQRDDPQLPAAAATLGPTCVAQQQLLLLTIHYSQCSALTAQQNIHSAYLEQVVALKLRLL